MAVRKKISVSIISLITLLLVPNLAFSQQAVNILPTAKDFAIIPNHGFELSPNGKKITFILGLANSAKVFLFDLETGAIENVVSTPEFNIDSVGWANDDIILVYLSRTKNLAEGKAHLSETMHKISRTLSYSISKKSMAFIMPYDSLSNYNFNIPIEYISYNEGGKLYVSAYDYNTNRTESEIKKARENGNSDYIVNLYKVDPLTGRGTIILSGNEFTSGYYFNKAGNIKIRRDVNEAKGTKTYFVAKENIYNWKQFAQTKILSDNEFVLDGILDDNYVLINQKVDGISREFKLNINDGTKIEMFPNIKESVNFIISDPFTQDPLGIAYDGLDNKVEWLDSKFAEVSQNVAKLFDGKSVSISSWDRARVNFVIDVLSPDEPNVAYLYDTSLKSIEPLTDFPEAFANYKFAKKTLETFKASDGLEIPVYITTPPQSSKKPLPAIVIPHGGPEAHDTPFYDYFAQFLASRGYVIIQPQYRGSSGLGKEFIDAGRGEWGKKMQSDINESVKWAASKGLIDANRVCIAGASYGGYAALAGVTLTPDIYKCAVSIAGISDIKLMLQDEEAQNGFGSTETKYWRKNLGVDGNGMASIIASSPINSADKVRAPILLIHGTKDTTVFINQSEKMERALKSSGKSVKFIKIEGEDHHLQKESSRELILTEMESFLKQNIGNGLN
jgi:dipeptidyl aminopeptidase/acylaminoacyl peptidase